MNKKKTKMKKMVIAIVCILLIGAAVGTASAFFTDRDLASNVFTAGNVSVLLEEPSWNLQNGKNITPGKVIAKDPQAINDGVNNAYIFMRVTVPAASVIAAGPDGTRLPQARTNLFSYAINNGWIETAKDVQPDKSIYTYAYVATDGSLKTLLPGERTCAVFDSVKFANIIEGQLKQDTQLAVDVEVMAIQSDDIGSTDPLTVMKLIDNQAAK